MDSPFRNLPEISCSWGQTDSEQLQVLKELATLSWVQLVDLSSAVSGLTDVDEFDNVVVPDKTQYRIFFSNIQHGTFCHHRRNCSKTW